MNAFTPPPPFPRRPKAQISFETLVSTLQIISETYPKCFRIVECRRIPLKVGINNDIMDRFAGAITPLELGRTMHLYTASKGYLEHMQPGAWRVDLDGSHAGDVTAEEAAYAKERLDKLLAKAAAREAQAAAWRGPR